MNDMEEIAAAADAKFRELLQRKDELTRELDKIERQMQACLRAYKGAKEIAEFLNLDEEHKEVTNG